jgi:hypothetical protein
MATRHSPDALLPLPVATVQVQASSSAALNAAFRLAARRPSRGDLHRSSSRYVATVRRQVRLRRPSVLSSPEDVPRTGERGRSARAQRTGSIRRVICGPPTLAAAVDGRLQDTAQWPRAREHARVALRCVRVARSASSNVGGVL